MKQLFILLLALAGAQLHAQQDPIKPRFAQGCTLPPPDSVDITGDGIPDLLIHGVNGEATCDIPVSYGSCGVNVTTLPGTMLLSERLPTGGRRVIGFAHGDTIPALASGVQDDMHIPNYAFIEGSVQVLHWSYGKHGGSPAALTPMGLRVFVYATTMGDRIVRGTFTLHAILEASTVLVQAKDRTGADNSFIVP